MCLYLETMGFSEVDASIEHVFLFPPLRWDTLAREWVPSYHKKVTYSAVYTQFKKLLLNCGINHKKFALHSPRVEASTEAFRSKVPKHLIDRQGRWKNKKSKYRYARETSAEMANAYSYIKY